MENDQRTKKIKGKRKKEKYAKVEMTMALKFCHLEETPAGVQIGGLNCFSKGMNLSNI